VVPGAGIEPARLAAGDFLTTSAFAATVSTQCSWSGARLHHSLAALGARRLLSTPSEALYGAKAWLGISSDLRPGPSPSLTGFTSEVSPGGLKFGLSPLRLPISPPGQIGIQSTSLLSAEWRFRRSDRLSQFRRKWCKRLRKERLYTSWKTAARPQWIRVAGFCHDAGSGPDFWL